MEKISSAEDSQKETMGGSFSWIELMSKLGDIPKAKTLSLMAMIQGGV